MGCPNTRPCWFHPAALSSYVRRKANECFGKVYRVGERRRDGGNPPAQRYPRLSISWELEAATLSLTQKQKSPDQDNNRRVLCQGDLSRQKVFFGAHPR